MHNIIILYRYINTDMVSKTETSANALVLSSKGIKSYSPPGGITRPCIIRRNITKMPDNNALPITILIMLNKSIKYIFNN